SDAGPKAAPSMTALIVVLATASKRITAPMLNRNLTYGVSAAAILLATSSAAFAQETTGGIRGVITDAAGAPVANATVVVTHVPSGTSTTTVTGADGSYTSRNLRVGG